jgi:hypothetical protein
VAGEATISKKALMKIIGSQNSIGMAEPNDAGAPYHQYAA